MRGAWPQPWYDENGGLFPVFHVLRGLSGLSGRSLRALEISDPSAVQGVAVEAQSGTELWLANLTGREQTVSLPAPATDAAVLDAASFVEASRTPDSSRPVGELEVIHADAWPLLDGACSSLMVDSMKIIGLRYRIIAGDPTRRG